MEIENTNQQAQPLQSSSPLEQPIVPVKQSSSFKKIIIIAVLLIFSITAGTGAYYFILGKSQSIPQNPPQITKKPSTTPTSPPTKPADKGGSIFLTLKSGIPFDLIVKSVKAQVLGETTGKKSIPVQIFAFEDHNGNGVREPDDNALGFMPVNIYDSPFSSTPLNKINSTESGWASALIQVSEPHQLVINPMPTKDYYPTTKPIIVSEKNNFAVVGFEKRQEMNFHISVFAFEDANKDSNFNYDDKNEKALFLAPFKFYQQNESGGWDLFPNSVNSTDTGWATTTPGVKYPYIVKVEAGDLNNLTPSNKEVITSYSNATLIFPYTAK
ncbi:hypothetical protein HY439_00865 [Candidatus Microgenomates bacterium]|nr:hypothetical protein [Candidatus Microgenomates bacterium]